MPMLSEVARLLEEGVASKEKIDLLVKKGINIPFQKHKFPWVKVSRPA
jgi:3-hydroxyacyl-CoA dehydrogenase